MMRASHPISIKPCQPKPSNSPEAEWTIIKTVWDSRTLHRARHSGKTLQADRVDVSTVRTQMDRMVTKGPLKAAKEKNVTLYHTAVTQAQSSAR